MAGAVLFSLPMLMTMEMWWLGFHMDRWRLAVFLVFFFPILVALSYISGFEETFRAVDDIVDALVALAIATIAASIVLFVLGVIRPGMNTGEVLGKVMLQAIPGSIGALLAQSQLGEAEDKRAGRANKYVLELLTMAAGAIFLAFNVAPTEEVQLIARQMTAWHVLALMALALLIIHAFAHAADRSQENVREDLPWMAHLLRYTIMGYTVAMLLSFFVLWSFGRYEGVWLGEALRQTVVLAFPASVGAGAARLVL